MHICLEDNQVLPEGLWLVKWIDCFNLTRGYMHSPRVHLVLQKLRSDDILEIERLDEEVISYEVLGRYPNQHPDDTPQWEVRPVLAGMLPLLNIGQVFQGNKVVTSLRTRAATIKLVPGTRAFRASVMAEQSAPSGWKGSYRVLNRFEYELGKQREVVGAKCLTVVTPDVDYIIPGTVVFKTFYGFHTTLVNAFCSGQWQTRHRDVISTANFESGLRTGIDEATGDWYIVVQTGMTRAHAERLALLIFDPHAYECACDIHADSLEQNRYRRADDDRYWFANPRIPYVWDKVPFEMQVRGFSLRPPGSSSSTRQRFLVTSIDAYSWPHVDQTIHSEAANSNALSSNPKVEKVPRPYRPPKPPPVPADPQAQPDHHQDSDQDDPVNEAVEGRFSFLNKPKHLKQVKGSHKEYEPPPPTPRAGSSPIVSAGNQTSGEGNPAPLVGDARERFPSQQLQFLLNALDALLEEGRIDSHKPLAPQPASHLRCLRNGIPCWNFLSEEQVRNPASNERGWEFISENVEYRGGVVRRSYPRCLLVVLVVLRGQEILIFEVERRPRENGYCTYLMTSNTGFSLIDIEVTVERIREQLGRVEPASLREVFERVSSRPLARRHTYVRSADGLNITGLDASGLFRRLESTLLAESQDTDDAL